MSTSSNARDTSGQGTPQEGAPFDDSSQLRQTGITFPLSDHSYYYHDKGESLFSMSDIVSGHGDALQHDGMTARHRTEILGHEIDPELLRPGTSGHTHEHK